MEHTAMKPRLSSLFALGTRAASPWHFAARLSSLVTLLSSLAAGAACAADFSWTPRFDRADPVEIDLYRGETLRLLPRLPTNVVAESLHWQTNGMESLWWSAPGTVFAPTNDCGAPRYRFFVRCRDADGVLYRANGALRMLGSPGFTPSTLPLPVQSIDFAQVAATNAPWTLPTEVDASIAAATNAIPAPDLSAYPDYSAVTGIVAAATNAIPAPDLSAYLRTEDAPAIIGDTAYVRGGDIDLGEFAGVHATNAFLDIAFSAVRADDGSGSWSKLEVSSQGIVASGNDGFYGDNYLELSHSGLQMQFMGENVQLNPHGGWTYDDGFTYFKEWSWRDLADTVSPVYAEAAPFSVSVAMCAPQGFVDTYAVTNGDTAAEYMRSGTYADAQCSVVVEDRPAGYAYEAPTGTWSIVSDPAGAASGITRDGYLSSSRTNSGSVVVEYATPSNGSRRAAVWLSQSAADRKVRDGLEVPGTFRHACGTNILARFAAVDYSGPRHSYSCGRSIPDALAPYDGFSANPPSGANPSFFWPEIMPALLCVSIGRSDLGGIRSQKLLAISPHFAVAAKHFGEVPPSAWGEYFCTNYAPFARMKVTCLNPRIGNPANDLALIRFREALPTNCIAKLVRASDAESLSPSLFKGAVGINLTQHNTLAPVHVRDAYNPWAFEEHPAATNAVHAPLHVGDSGTPCGILTPGLKYIPLFSVHTADCAGPSLLDADNQAWIEARLAEYGESPTYWNLEDLR